MHDIRTIRDNPAAFDAALSRRGLAPVSSRILAMDEARRAKILAAETAQAEANKAAKDVGAAKARGDDAEFERLRALVGEKKAQIAALNDEAKAEDAALTNLLMGIPNLPDENIPDGADENDNVEIHRHGTPRALDFAPLEHFDIPAIRPGMDFETAANQSRLGLLARVLRLRPFDRDGPTRVVDVSQTAIDRIACDPAYQPKTLAKVLPKLQETLTKDDLLPPR